MIQNQTDQCNPTYNFFPRKQTPNFFPMYTWGLIPLNISNKNNGIHYVNLKESNTPLENIIFELYPQLSFTELSRFYVCYFPYFESEVWPHIFAKYDYKLNESFLLLVKSIVKTPISFQDWCSEKSISPRDLEIIRFTELTHKHKHTLKAIAQLNFTKSTGIQILDLCFELIEMKNGVIDIENIFSSASAEKILGSLKALRYPVTSSSDLQKHDTLKSLPNLTGAEVNWKRINDRAGLEIKLHAISSSDLERKIKSLQRWQNEFGEVLWI